MRATTRCSHAFITSQLPRQSIPPHLRTSLHLHSNSPRLRYFTTTPTLTPTSSTSDPVSLTRPFASTSKSAATMTNIVQNLKGAATSHPTSRQSQNQDLPAPYVGSILGSLTYGLKLSTLTVHFPAPTMTPQIRSKFANEIIPTVLLLPLLSRSRIRQRDVSWWMEDRTRLHTN